MSLPQWLNFNLFSQKDCDIRQNSITKIFFYPSTYCNNPHGILFRLSYLFTIKIRRQWNENPKKSYFHQTWCGTDRLINNGFLLDAESFVNHEIIFTNNHKQRFFSTIFCRNYSPVYSRLTEWMLESFPKWLFMLCFRRKQDYNNYFLSLLNLLTYIPRSFRHEFIS